jgi:hypothetical protein
VRSGALTGGEIVPGCRFAQPGYTLLLAETSGFADEKAAPTGPHLPQKGHVEIDKVQIGPGSEKWIAPCE